jgi:hypothetical protein
MKKSIIYISSLLLASCAHASLEFSQDTPRGLRKTGRLTAYEDAMLLHLVALYGTGNWAAIGRQFPNRARQQVYDRWNKFLNPALVKGNGTPAEDETIRRWVGENGPQNWADLARQLPGRTGRRCKERWVQLNWSPQQQPAPSEPQPMPETDEPFHGDLLLQTEFEAAEAAFDIPERKMEVRIIDWSPSSSILEDSIVGIISQTHFTDS